MDRKAMECICKDEPKREWEEHRGRRGPGRRGAKIRDLNIVRWNVSTMSNK